MPLAMRHADFYLLDLFISCSAGDGSQGFCLLDKSSASELPLKPCCDVLKLWFRKDTQCHQRALFTQRHRDAHKSRHQFPGNHGAVNRKEIAAG